VDLVSGLISFSPVEIITKEGAKLRGHGARRGTVENSMTREEVEEKSRARVTPVLGEDRSEKVY
jgi:hypothetical protein